MAAQGGNEKPTFDLEERTFRFAQDVRAFVKKLPRNVCNLEDVRQLVRASGSVGANYIEANEGLGKKDARLHLRIARKEAKESRFYLRLLDTGGDRKLEAWREALVRESRELTSILSAMVKKAE
ncbi:MAG: four helix bundle protein [Planctomycetota bacterium]|nr:four helix bundle protein [Planctomycetota bacterium]